MPPQRPRDSTGRYATAKVRLVMEGGRKVREELVVTGQFFSDHLGTKVAGSAVHRTQLGIRTLIGSLFELRTVIATVGKALISGFAITAVFGALFLAVNALKAIFIDAGEFALKTVSQLKEMRLGLQALLATTSEFAIGTEKNFELAGRAASQLREELIALDPQTLGGLKELQVATQALLATGAQGMVSSTDAARELAGVASLLVNAVVLITGRVNDQRQIFSEIKELMLGNVRAQNQVAQLIASQVGDLDAWLARGRKNRNLFEEIRKLLGGINSAADEFLNTLTSVQASEEAITALITEAAYDEKVDSIIRRKRELLDYTDKNKAAIARLKEEMSGWIFLWQSAVLIADNLLTRTIAIGGKLIELQDRFKTYVRSLQDTNRAIFTGELFELPTIQEGGGDTLGLTKSMEVLDTIRKEVKGVGSDLEKMHTLATKSAGNLMDAFSRGMFNLNNVLMEGNKALKILIDARKEMRAIADFRSQYADATKLVAAREVISLTNQIDAFTNSMKAFETNTLAKLLRDREEARVKSERRIAAAFSALNAINISGLSQILTIEEKVGLARQNALRSMERQLTILERENVAAGERARWESQTTARIEDQTKALGEYLQLRSDERIAEAETSLSRIRVSGLNKILTIEQKVTRAMEDAFVVRDRELGVLREELVGAERLAELEKETTAEIKAQGKALREQLHLRVAERIASAMLDLDNLHITGLNRILTIEEQVEHSMSGGLRSMERLLNVLFDMGVPLVMRLQKEMEIRKELEGQGEALEKHRQLQESFREGRHLLERFSLQRQGVILPGEQPTSFRQLMDERNRRVGQLAGLRSDDSAGPEDIREAETLVASLESELRNLLSTANSVASVIGGALTKAVLTVADKGGSLIDFFKNLRANIKAVGEQMIFAFGQAFANAIQNMITGTSSMKEAIGGLIIAVGNLAIALGTVLILGSIFFGFGSIPIGLALIAAGAGMIALGALLGGSGPQGGALGAQPNATNQVPTFSFNQAQVDVQQGHARSNADLVQATSSLADAHRSLKSMPPGMVVKKGNTENGGLLTSVSQESGQGRQFTAQTNLAKNLRGS